MGDSWWLSFAGVKAKSLEEYHPNDSAKRDINGHMEVWILDCNDEGR